MICFCFFHLLKVFSVPTGVGVLSVNSISEHTGLAWLGSLKKYTAGQKHAFKKVQPCVAYVAYVGGSISCLSGF